MNHTRLHAMEPCATPVLHTKPYQTQTAQNSATNSSASASTALAPAGQEGFDREHSEDSDSDGDGDSDGSEQEEVVDSESTVTTKRVIESSSLQALKRGRFED